MTADKPESQEICFVPGGDYRDALRERAGWQPEPGPLIDVDGERVGEHRGSAGYTVGQRQGLGVALGAAALRQPHRPADEHDPAGTARGPRDAPFRPRARQLRRRRAPPASEFRADVRIRHRATPIRATLVERGDRPLDGDTDEPVWAAAPGQAAVLYDGDVVLGGGRIARETVGSSTPVAEPALAASA